MARLKDIAQKAGVSVRTVNRVLKNQPYVKPEIVKLVKKIADDLQYFPNLTARALSININNDIVLFSPSINDINLECIQGIESSVKALNLNLKIILTNENEDLISTAKLAFSQKPKGIIFSRYENMKEMLKQNKFQVPYIVLEGESDSYHSIDFDRATGIKESIRYLHRLGCRKIAYLGYNKKTGVQSKHRLEGYLAGLKEFDLKPIYFPLGLGYEQYTQAREIGRNFEKLKPRPDAMQCYTDYAACGFIAGLNDSQIFVKNVVKIVGFNNNPFAQWSSPPLTTISLPRFEMGKSAVESIVKQLNSTKKETVQLRLKTSLEIRETT